MHLDNRGRLPMRLILSYAAPGIATTSISFLVAVYITDFYVSLGANLGFISFFTALARSFDVITDPLMGWITDNTRSKYGRRRPYMFLGCFFYCLLLTLLLSPPGKVGEEGNGVAIWFGIFYTIFYLSDTFTNVPYEALGPELSDNYEERNRVFFAAKIFVFTGTLFAAAAPGMVALFLRIRDWRYAFVDCAAIYNNASFASSPPAVSYPHYRMEPEGNLCAASERCQSSSGFFCFEQVQDDGSQNFLEVENGVLERTCAAASGLPAPGQVLGGGNDTCILGGGQFWPEAVGDCVTDSCVRFVQYSMSDISSYRWAFTITGVIFGLYSILAMTNCVRVIRERPQSLDQPRAPLAACVLRAFKNVAFRPLLMAWTLDGLALSALVAMFPFYVRYVIISDGYQAQEKGTAWQPMVLMGSSLVALLLTAMLASPFWLWVSRRLGKYRGWLLYNLANVFTNLLFLIPGEGDNVLTVVIMMLNGIPVGGQFLITSILADVIDYDEFLNGMRNEGSFSVFATLIPKFVAIPAYTVPLAIAFGLGFKEPVDGVAQPQSDQVKNFIKFTFVLLPFVCALLAFFIKTRFPIRTKETSDAIALGIARHSIGKRAVDPITGHAVEILELSAEEEQIAWYYENYSADDLKRLKEDGPNFLREKMLVTVRLSGFLFVTLLAITAATFRYVDDRKLSIIPVLSVIFPGMMLCFFVLSYLRWKDSLKILVPDDDVDHYKLIRKIERSKRMGARAGDVIECTDELAPLAVVRRGSILGAPAPLLELQRQMSGLDAPDLGQEYTGKGFEI